MNIPFDGNIYFKEALWGTLLTGTIAYSVIALGLYVSFMPKAKQATRVIAALGFNNPANVGLGLVDRDAKDKWEKANNAPFPKEQYDEYALFY